MAKTNIKDIIKQCMMEVLNEELDVPSQDGSADGADPDNKEKAKKASQDGDTVKFVKPGDIKEKKKGDDKEDDDKKDDKEEKKDDKKSDKKDDKKDDKKSDKKSDKKDDKESDDDSEEGEEGDGAVSMEKVSELISQLSGLTNELSELQAYAKDSQDKKMASTFGKLGKNCTESLNLISQLKEMKEGLIQEDAEKSNEFGDKVIKCLSKNFKDEKSGAKLKEKYMPFIAAGYKKGKKPQEIAERISQHRFEM